MALETLTLDSLGRSKLGKQFEEALEHVTQSFDKNEDVPGARKVTIELSFSRNELGQYISEMKCFAKTPTRSFKGVAAINENKLAIDTATNNAEEPSMFDDPAAKDGKVVDIREASGAGGQ